MERSEARETAPRYLTPAEVAHDLRVSNNTVYAMLIGRELPARPRPVAHPRRPVRPQGRGGRG